MHKDMETDFTRLLSRLREINESFSTAQTQEQLKLRKEQGLVERQIVDLLPLLPEKTVREHADQLRIGKRLKKAAGSDFRLLPALRIIAPSDLDALLAREITSLRKFVLGSSLERFAAARRMHALLDAVPPEDQVAADLLPIAVRLFRDENTDIWRYGAYCLGQLFHFPPAREFLEHLYSYPAAKNRPVSTNIHARRHALAALGHVAARDPDFAARQAGAIFAPMPEETDKAFRARRNIWFEASFAFALNGYIRTQPVLALEYFQRLTAYPVRVGENFGLHNSLLTIVEDLLRGPLAENAPLFQAWRESITSWHTSLADYFLQTDETDIQKRYQRRTIINHSAYQQVGDMLQKSGGVSAGNEAETPLLELDRFAAEIDQQCVRIRNRELDVLARVDEFITVSNKIKHFFNAGGMPRPDSRSTPPDHDLHRAQTRWEQLASNAKMHLGLVLSSAMEHMDHVDPQLRSEAKLQVAYGIQLLGLVYDALPEQNHRNDIREHLRLILRTPHEYFKPGSLYVKYMATIVERLLDGIWNGLYDSPQAHQDRCLAVHALVEDVAALSSGKAILEKTPELVREEAAAACLIQSYRIIYDRAFPAGKNIECALCSGKWKPIRNLLPEFHHINGLLTNSAGPDGQGILDNMTDLAERLGIPVDLDQARTTLWPLLISAPDPRHKLREQWAAASAPERAATVDFLRQFLTRCFTQLLMDKGIDRRMNCDPESVGQHFARALLAPVGRVLAGKYAGTTLFGALQAPGAPATGCDQLQGQLTCLIELDDDVIDTPPWKAGDPVQPDVKNRNMLHLDFRTDRDADRPPLSLPWFLILGLIQALAQDAHDSAWRNCSRVIIHRSVRESKTAYRITLHPDGGAPWRVDRNNPLRTGDIAYAQGAHKVGFWLHWINIILGSGRPCWKIAQSWEYQTTCLEIEFPLPAVPENTAQPPQQGAAPRPSGQKEQRPVMVTPSGDAKERSDAASTQRIELYWLHQDVLNPPDAFWEQVASLPHVTVHKVTDNDARATTERGEMLDKLLKNPAEEHVLRLAMLHISDVLKHQGRHTLEETIEAQAGTPMDPRLVTVYFTKGGPQYQASPPILHLPADVLPRLEPDILPLLRENAHQDRIRQSFQTWVPRTAEVNGAADILLALDILIQGAILLLESDQPEHQAARDGLCKNPYQWYETVQPHLRDAQEAQSLVIEKISALAELIRTLQSPGSQPPEHLLNLPFLRQAHEECLQAVQT
jgi:hypothetical protein